MENVETEKRKPGNSNHLLQQKMKSLVERPSFKHALKHSFWKKRRTVGVTSAAERHPHFWKMNLPNIIITRVTIPVADEKLPIKAEYSLGLGNAACSEKNWK